MQQPLRILLTIASLAAADPGFCNVKFDPVPNTQSLQGPSVIGSPVSANSLHKKFWHEPRRAALHIDGGNTRTVDYPGPLGRKMTVTSYTTPYPQVFWDFHDSMFVACGGACNGSDPVFGEVLMDTQQAILTNGNTTWVVQKCGTKLDTIRTIDLQLTLGDYPLLTAMMDALGNLWFTSGGLGAASATNRTPANDTLVGYIEPSGKINSLQLADLTVENGIAINNDSMIFSTGPIEPNDHASATGYTAKLTSSADGVRVAWNSSYDAGSGRRYPAAFARGSGTTPSLLGDDFVAINDNADNQTNIVIFSQKTGEHVCKVPLPNGGRSDNCGISHFDGENYGVVMQNMYNVIPFTATLNKSDRAWSNGPWHNQAAWNNNSVRTPGISKFFVAGNGSGCNLEWTNTDSGMMTTDPVLFTATGLLYGYEQSVDLAKEGQREWHASAIDWMTGKTVWKIRAGAGGSYNNFYQTAFLGRDGALYHGINGGLVSIKDS